MKNNKKTATLRLAALFLLVVHLLALTAFASGSGTILDVQVWTEGALTPATQTKGDGTQTVTSTNAPGDWWKVKVELPRSVETGKTYEATFVFTSNATGTIKYNVDGAEYLTSNEYNVQNGENTFTVRFTAGADTYNCLELGGLGAFALTFTEASVKEVSSNPETGDSLDVVLAMAAVAAVAGCAIICKKRELVEVFLKMKP